MTFMTCMAGSIEFASYPSLSEKLSVVGNKGASAVWSPSGLSHNSTAAKMASDFYRLATVDGAITLGDAVVEIKRLSSENGGEHFMLDIYNLLGDPALPLQ